MLTFSSQKLLSHTFPKLSPFLPSLSPLSPFPPPPLSQTITTIPLLPPPTRPTTAPPTIPLPSEPFPGILLTHSALSHLLPLFSKLDLSPLSPPSTTPPLSSLPHTFRDRGTMSKGVREEEGVKGGLVGVPKEYEKELRRVVDKGREVIKKGAWATVCLAWPNCRLTLTPTPSFLPSLPSPSSLDPSSSSSPTSPSSIPSPSPYPAHKIAPFCFLDPLPSPSSLSPTSSSLPSSPLFSLPPRLRGKRKRKRRRGGVKMVQTRAGSMSAQRDSRKQFVESLVSRERMTWWGERHGLPCLLYFCDRAKNEKTDFERLEDLASSPITRSYYDTLIATTVEALFGYLAEDSEERAIAASIELLHKGEQPPGFFISKREARMALGRVMNSHSFFHNKKIVPRFSPIISNEPPPSPPKRGRKGKEKDKREEVGLRVGGVSGKGEGDSTGEAMAMASYKILNKILYSRDEDALEWLLEDLTKDEKSAIPLSRTLKKSVFLSSEGDSFAENELEFLWNHINVFSGEGGGGRGGSYLFPEEERGGGIEEVLRREVMRANDSSEYCATKTRNLQILSMIPKIGDFNNFKDAHSLLSLYRLQLILQQLSIEWNDVLQLFPPGEKGKGGWEKEWGKRQEVVAMRTGNAPILISKYVWRYKKLFPYENQPQQSQGFPKTRGNKKYSSFVSSARTREEKKKREGARRREAVGGVLHFLGWVEQEMVSLKEEEDGKKKRKERKKKGQNE